MPQVNQKVILLSHTLSPIDTISLSARLCYSKSTVEELKEKVEGTSQEEFISRIMNMGHLSTVEHASFTFGIEGVSRALLAQITRHRIASFSVQSQRYVKVKEDFSYIVPPAIENLGAEEVAEYKRQMSEIGKFYSYWQEKLGKGGESTNEDARFVLPNAAETKFIVTMNARELLHFFKLRCCKRAQWEIYNLAWKMLEEVMKVAKPIFQYSSSPCAYGKCPEGEKCCGSQREMKEKIQKIVSNLGE